MDIEQKSASVSFLHGRDVLFFGILTDLYFKSVCQAMIHLDSASCVLELGTGDTVTHNCPEKSLEGDIFALLLTPSQLNKHEELNVGLGQGPCNPSNNARQQTAF